jgi:hypothetical protein
MKKFKNEHLLPVNIVDLVEKLNQPNIRENERMNYVLRLETIREYCDLAVKKSDQDAKKKIPDWKITRDYCG